MSYITRIALLCLLTPGSSFCQTALTDLVVSLNSCVYGDTLVTVTMESAAYVGEELYVVKAGTHRIELYNVAGTRLDMLRDTVIESPLRLTNTTCGREGIALEGVRHLEDSTQIIFYSYALDYDLSVLNTSSVEIPVIDSNIYQDRRYSWPAVQHVRDITYVVPSKISNRIYGKDTIGQYNHYIYALRKGSVISRHLWNIGTTSDIYRAKIINNRFTVVQSGSPYFSPVLTPGTDQLDLEFPYRKLYRYYDNAQYYGKTPHATNHVLLNDSKYSYAFGDVSRNFELLFSNVVGAKNLALLALKFDSSFNIADSTTLFQKYEIPYRGIKGNSISYGRFAAFGRNGDIYTTMCVRDNSDDVDSTSVYLARIDTSLNVIWDKLLRIDIYQYLYEIQPLSRDRVHIITRDNYPFDWEDPRNIQYFSYVVDRNGIISATPLGAATNRLPSLRVSPNPINSVAKLEGIPESSDYAELRGEIYDASGRIVSTVQFGTDAAFSLDGLTAGSYLIRVLDATNLMVGVARVVKQ